MKVMKELGDRGKKPKAGDQNIWCLKRLSIILITCVVSLSKSRVNIISAELIDCVRTLLSGFYTRISKISHTRVKCVTCPWTPNSEIQHSCANPRMGCLE